MTNVHNTLYVTAPDAWVGVEGETLKVMVGTEKRAQVPMHHLVSVVCFHSTRMSAEAMAGCAERGVSVVWLGHNGRYLARVEGSPGYTATLRRSQYRSADDLARTLALAKAFVGGKIANTRTLLRRAGRTRADETDALDRAAERLRVLVPRVLEAGDLDALRGIEGEAAARYFEVFDAMLGEGPLRFEKRSRRPPENPINAMLSFGYGLLTADCVSALNSAGLDPAVGFLHPERSARPSLALDLMEEFRAAVVDRMVLARVRRAQVAIGDFDALPTGEVRMRDAARKAFVVEYQQRKQEDVTHPFTGQSGTWALMPHLQARLLARAIRGEGEYVPFLLK